MFVILNTIYMKKLPVSFYARKDVVLIAKELLGKIIVTNFEGQVTSGRIVETEAYAGITDKASHSFGNRRTARNEHMYAAGRHSLCLYLLRPSSNA